jgi:hypothetical protein
MAAVVMIVPDEAAVCDSSAVGVDQFMTQSSQRVPCDRPDHAVGGSNRFAINSPNQPVVATGALVSALHVGQSNVPVTAEPHSRPGATPHR